MNCNASYFLQTKYFKKILSFVCFISDTRALFVGCVYSLKKNCFIVYFYLRCSFLVADFKVIFALNGSWSGFGGNNENISCYHVSEHFLDEQKFLLNFPHIIQANSFMYILSEAFCAVVCRHFRHQSSVVIHWNILWSIKFCFKIFKKNYRYNSSLIIRIVFCIE